METTTQIQKVERKDSIEFGTPSKNGAVKVYFDADNPEQAKLLIDNALKIREYLKSKVEQ
jgi:hypothetical protein